MNKMFGKHPVMKYGVLALIVIMAAVVVVQIVPGGSENSSAATTVNIDDWTTAGTTITLHDGDILNISSDAGSPTAATEIDIAANANVTINGTGSMISNLHIIESSSDTMAHTVSINDLKITAPTGVNTCYNQYMSTIDLKGTNEFDGNSTTSNGMIWRSAASGITSSTGGTLTINGYARPAVDASTGAFNIEGNATVTAYGGTSSVGVSGLIIKVDGGATLNATGDGNTGIYATGNLTITNEGTLNVTGGTGAAAIYCNGTLTFTMRPGATTTLTNNSGVGETHVFTMGAAGNIWSLSGDATFSGGSVATDSSASISIPSGGTGAITLTGPVCEIGSTTYMSLEDALAVVASGQTITLLANITDNNDIWMDQGFAFTIDKAGFDLTINGELDVVSATDVTITGAGALTLYDTYVTDSGSKLTVTGDLTCHWLDPEDGGAVDVSGNVTSTYNNPDDCFSYMDNGANLNIGGWVVAGSSAFYIETDSTLTVGGNITAGGYGIDAEDGSTVTVTGDVKAGDDIKGVYATDSGTKVTVTGGVTAGDYVSNGCWGVYAENGAEINVTGVVTVGFSCDGVDAYNSGTNVTVGGIATGDDSCGVNANDSAAVIVNGSIEMGDNCDGVNVWGGAEVTVNGAITMNGDFYILIEGYPYDFADYSTPTTLPNYLTYTDGTSTVWVLDTADFVAVTDITGVPTTATVGKSLTLTGTVAPSTASFKTIVWSIKDAGATGATISGNSLSTTAAGKVVVTATIINGSAIGTPFEKDFTITVSSSGSGTVPVVPTVFIAVTDITGVPSSATAGTQIILNGTVTPSNATNTAINWSIKSAGTTGATIDGKVIAFAGTGTVVVTATIGDGKAVGTPFTKDFTITVNADTSGTSASTDTGGSSSVWLWVGVLVVIIIILLAVAIIFHRRAH